MKTCFGVQHLKDKRDFQQIKLRCKQLLNINTITISKSTLNDECNIDHCQDNQDYEKV